MLIAQNLTRRIKDNVIWSGINISLREGERVALRGPSGSGKTLLMRVLSGLDPADEGEISYHDLPLSHWHLPEYRRHVRYIPQDATFLSGTVRDSIARFFSFKVNHDLSLDPIRLRTFLEVLALPESFLDKTADRLSGGEKQIVALFRSLLLKPHILLLDEPTSNLDEEMVSRAEQLVDLWFQEESGRSLIWTSHDSRQLDRMTNTSIVLSNSNDQHHFHS